MQSSKSGKTRKSGLVLMSRQGKFADLFLVFPVWLETWPKAFHLYSFFKCSRNEAFKPFFSQFDQRVAMEMMTVRNIATSVLAMYFQILWMCKVSSPSNGRRKSYQWSKFSIFLFLTTIRKSTIFFPGQKMSKIPSIDKKILTGKFSLTSFIKMRHYCGEFLQFLSLLTLCP